MNDEMRKRVISILSTAIAFWLASRLAERFMQQPEVRGVRDDFKEGLLQAAFSLAADSLLHHPTTCQQPLGRLKATTGASGGVREPLGALQGPGFRLSLRP